MPRLQLYRASKYPSSRLRSAPLSSGRHHRLAGFVSARLAFHVRDWKDDSELRAHAFPRMDLDLAAVLFDDLVDDRQTEPGPLSDGLGGEERIEDLRQHVSRDADAVVDDIDGDPVLTMHPAHDRDPPAFVRRRLRGIRKEVQEDLIDLRRRAAQRRGAGEHLFHDLALENGLG